MVKKELEFFHIGDSLGGNQDWCLDHMMQLGGCAAVTACDCSIYFALRRGHRALYPGDPERIDRDRYLYFTEEMKHYLHPRWSGIDKLSLFAKGYQKYLEDRGEHGIGIEALEGSSDPEEAKKAVLRQIDASLPVPCLILNHKDPALEDYVWHWFLLIGCCYQGEDPLSEEADFSVLTLTYSEAKWVKLDALWETGYSPRGGLILFQENKEDILAPTAAVSGAETIS